MSWSLFNRKKSTSRDNHEFEAQTDKIKSLDESTKQVNKEIKKVINNGNLYGKAVCKLSEHLLTELSVYEQESDAVKNLDESVAQQEQIIREMITGLDQTVWSAVKKYSSLFQSFDELVKRHDKCLSEYSRLDEKLHKHKEQRKISNTMKIEQLKREMEPVKEEYEQVEKKLMEESTMLYNTRLDYLYPSFNALVAIQRLSLNETLKSIEKNNGPSHQDEQQHKEDRSIDDILQEIRTLCITADE